MLDDVRGALEAAEVWQRVTLSTDEQRAFDEAARTLPFGDAEGRTETPITAEQLLAPRRAEDAGDGGAAMPRTARGPSPHARSPASTATCA